MNRTTPDSKTSQLPSQDVAELRLQVMLRLASALERGQAAVLGPDLEVLERDLDEQQALCRQWQALEAQLAEARPAGDARLECGTGWEAHDARLSAVCQRLRVLVRVHAVLLARSRRAARILENLLASTRATYGPFEPARKLSAKAGK